ncbi:hypothetical protein [Nevskia sp.]|uniref:hypothetical protein n=1 Tax=Nevskia sp. TaxID=1929292 RepID=UPI0025F63640|nr:hypothetical protein [Nevskia sp.]
MTLMPMINIAAPRALVLTPPAAAPITTAFVDQNGAPVLLTDIVRPGDRCTIRTRQGQEISGKAVIINRDQNVVVLNGGGKYGRPVIACEENIVKIKKAK